MAEGIGKGGGDNESGRAEMCFRDDEAGRERGQWPHVPEAGFSKPEPKTSLPKRPEKAALNAPEVCAGRPLCAIRQQIVAVACAAALTTPAKAKALSGGGFHRYGRKR